MIGQILKNLREERGFQAQYVATKINVAKSTYSGYENNKSQPDYDTLEKLADFFNVSVDFLLGRNNDDKTNSNSIEKAEKSIDEELDEVLDKLASSGAGLMFKGQILSDTTKYALLNSLKNVIEMAEKMAQMDINNQDKE